jgi:hypothetical protein
MHVKKIVTCVVPVLMKFVFTVWLRSTDDSLLPSHADHPLHFFGGFQPKEDLAFWLQQWPFSFFRIGFFNDPAKSVQILSCIVVQLNPSESGRRRREVNLKSSDLSLFCGLPCQIGSGAWVHSFGPAFSIAPGILKLEIGFTEKLGGKFLV